MIGAADQLAGFYMRATLTFNGLIGRSVFLLNCIFCVHKFKLKPVIYHKKVFPSDKNSFLQAKIPITFIVHTLTLRENTNCKNTVDKSIATIRHDTVFTLEFHRDEARNVKIIIYIGIFVST